MSDVTVIGGGVIGLSIACELAGQGHSVRLLERGEFGREASWAGAGMLPPGNPECRMDVESWLRGISHRLWPEWSGFLREETGLDNGFHRYGGLQIRTDIETDGLQSEISRWRDEGVRIEPLDDPGIRHLEPKIHPRINQGYLLPDMGQVRNPRHLKALVACCERRGVSLVSHCEVLEISTRNGRIASVQTSQGPFQSEAWVLAGGPWSKRLTDGLDCPLRLEPVRGQMLLLRTSPGFLHRILESSKRYIVPRLDGRVLVGSTEEWVGFQKENTVSGIGGLMRFALGLIPELADAAIESTWSGLRPCAPDGLPYIGFVPGAENLILASGHFRSGLQLSPATAWLVGRLLNGQEETNGLPLEQLSPSRDSGDIVHEEIMMESISRNE